MGRGAKSRKSKRGQAFATSLKKSSSSAYTKEDGTVLWQDAKGALHRVDGPAIRGVDGSEAWYLDGVLHRESGPAVIISNPDLGIPKEEWYKNGLLHRADGPAKIFLDGREEWWQNGELHREGGPALVHANGREEYFLRGKNYTREEWLER